MTTSRNPEAVRVWLQQLELDEYAELLVDNGCAFSCDLSRNSQTELLSLLLCIVCALFFQLSILMIAALSLVCHASAAALAERFSRFLCCQDAAKLQCSCFELDDCAVEISLGLFPLNFSFFLAAVCAGSIRWRQSLRSRRMICEHSASKLGTLV